MTTLQRFEDDLARALRAAAPAIAADRDLPRRAPGRRWRRSLTWPAMAAVTAAVVIAVLALSPERPSPEPALASAATLLRQAADAARPAPAHGYAYTRWTFRSTAPTAERRSGVQEQWTDAGGHGTRIERGGGRPTSTIRLTGHVPLGPTNVDAAAIARAAADPATLDRLITAQARRVVGLPAAQARAFITYELLENALIADAPAPARAALLRRLAAAPGLHRAGSTVTLTISAVRFTLRLHDARVVGTERRLVRRSPQVPGPPRVLDAWRLVSSGTVARQGIRP
jgi:hypothetical protein